MPVRLLDLEDVIDGDEAKTTLAEIEGWLLKTNSGPVTVAGDAVEARRVVYASARVMQHPRGVPMVVHRVYIHSEPVPDTARGIDMKFLEDTEVAGRGLVDAKAAHADARAKVKAAQVERSLQTHKKIQAEIDTLAAEAREAEAKKVSAEARAKVAEKDAGIDDND